MSWPELLAQAPEVAARNDARYFAVGCGRVLNPVRVPGLPFDLSANPYLNCEVGCHYCYAREFAGKRQGPLSLAFDRDVYAKEDAPAVLRRELARLAASDRLSRPVALGTATDPYQPVERERGLTRRLLEVFLDAAARVPRERGLRLSVTTKSALVLRDLDLLKELDRAGHLRLNVTVTTTDRELARSLEPRAPTPALRLEALERLARAGIPTGVFAMPILPEITCDTRGLRRLMCEAKAAGAGWLSARVLFLRGAARPAFFEWLSAERPSLVGLYRRYYGRSATPPDAVVERIRRTVDVLRRQYGLPAALDLPPAPPPRAGPDQLDLFGPAGASDRPRRVRRGRPLPRVAAAARPRQLEVFGGEAA